MRHAHDGVSGTAAVIIRIAVRSSAATGPFRSRYWAGLTAQRTVRTIAAREENDMGFFQDALVRFNRVVMSFAGDAVFMQAAVAAAANVIVADGETDEEEIEAALVSMRANPILEKSYDTLALEKELYEALARAELRAGRLENTQLVAAIADRPPEHRQHVFLIAADVADKGGVTESEHKVLEEIARVLDVDKAALLG